jgi:hypothetical protein
VYLTSYVAQAQHPLDYMKLELGHVMATAGYRIQWDDAWSGSRMRGFPSTSSTLVVVELRGSCAIPAGNIASGHPTARREILASTAVADGQILPFSWLDCASLTNVLAAPLAAEAGARRDFFYGRAMARLLAHELYHILLKTGDHAREGIARPGFTANDLLTEHFEFDETTLAKLRPPQAIPSSGASSEVSVAR